MDFFSLKILLKEIFTLQIKKTMVSDFFKMTAKYLRNETDFQVLFKVNFSKSMILSNQSC